MIEFRVSVEYDGRTASVRGEYEETTVGPEVRVLASGDRRRRWDYVAEVDDFEDAVSTACRFAFARRADR